MATSTHRGAANPILLLLPLTVVATGDDPRCQAKEEGTDQTGGQLIKQMANLQDADCCEQCLLTSGCTAWITNPDNHQCYLVKGSPLGRKKGNRNAGFVLEWTPMPAGGRGVTPVPCPFDEPDCHAAPPSKGGCGGGCAFLIVFFVGGFTYFAAGFAYKYKMKELRGAEAVPHAAFWRDLPDLIKDGVRFAGGKVRGGGYSAV